MDDDKTIVETFKDGWPDFKDAFVDTLLFARRPK